MLMPQGSRLRKKQSVIAVLTAGGQHNTIISEDLPNYVQPYEDSQTDEQRHEDNQNDARRPNCASS
jgi:hypothetical protein